MLPRRLLGRLTARPASPRAGGPTFARATRVVGQVDPSTFLRQAPGVPRGFWGGPTSWCAHVGAAARLELSAADLSAHGAAAANGHVSGTNGHVSGTNGHRTGPEGRDRIQELRRRSEELFARVHRPDGHAPPRLYGGLAFHDHHDATDEWTHFPSTSFLLPSLELVHRDGRTTLTATVRGTGSRRSDRHRAESALDQALEALREPPHGPAAGPTPVVADAGLAADWTDAVEQALAAIDGRQLAKVVLARTLDVDARGPQDPVAVVERLRRSDPEAHVFLFEPRPGAAFLGASPELVTRVRGSELVATAVAGSVPRGTDGPGDERLAQRLLDSKKDRAEHELVVDHLRRQLSAVAHRVQASDEPRLLRLARIQHLETPVHANLQDGVDVLDTLQALHPTPAVCGTPPDRALALMARVEPFERGWYAGPVGWFDAQGDGTFAPGLRSAVLHDGRWRLFAGAGIVAGSRPAAEWDETAVKFEPVLRALGAEDPTA